MTTFGHLEIGEQFIDLHDECVYVKKTVSTAQDVHYPFVTAFFNDMDEVEVDEGAIDDELGK